MTFYHESTDEERSAPAGFNTTTAELMGDVHWRPTEAELLNQVWVSVVELADRLRVNPVFADQDPVYQVLNVVGEAGEFAEAYRRYRGMARRTGSYTEVVSEWSDVIISALIFAALRAEDPRKMLEGLARNAARVAVRPVVLPGTENR